MEHNVRVLLANQAGVTEQQTLIGRHEKAADAGDSNARQIVGRAKAKHAELEAANEKLSDTVAEDAARYQSIPAIPHPEIDKRGARQEDAAENRKQARKDLAVDAGLAAAGIGAAAAGRKAVGAAAASAGMATAKGAAAYTRALRSATAAAMRKDGVDFADKKAVAGWVRENPELSRKLQSHALQAAVAAGASQVTGDMAGRLVENPVGRLVTKKGIEKTTDAILRPKTFE